MPKMKFQSQTLLSTLTLLAIVSAPQGNKDIMNQYEKWDYRQGAGRVNILGMRSITGTLEKWANKMFNEGKDALMYKPEVLLPEYTGIRSLSEALDDLLKDVNALKKRLGELNDRLDGINKAIIRKRLHIAPRNPTVSQVRLSNILQRRQGKITQPPVRPYPVRRRVYIRRRKVKARSPPSV